jgi:hypothetical protein
MVSLDEQLAKMRSTVVQNCMDRLSEASQKCKIIKKDYEEKGITSVLKRNCGL